MNGCFGILDIIANFFLMENVFRKIGIDFVLRRTNSNMIHTC